MSFCLEGGFGCKNVLSVITLLDKIFKVLTEGSALISLVSLSVVEGTVVPRCGTSRVVCFCLRMLHLGLTFVGFEDTLDRELQRGEAVGFSLGLELALLSVQEWLLLQSALSATMEVNRGAFVLQLQFCSIIIAVERRTGGAF